MELVAENLNPKERNYICPNCGAYYADCFDCEEVEGNTLYVHWECPGCGLDVEEVFTLSNINVWKND